MSNSTEKEILQEQEQMENELSDANMTAEEEQNENMSEENAENKIIDEVAEWKDKYTRLLAEFENYKKRSFKEKLETIQTAGREVIQSMIEVLDDCERAEKTMEASTDVTMVKDGVQLVFNKLKKTLEQKGLKSFDSKGNEFDVELHEAVTEIVAGNDNAGKVVDELQKGYYLNEKLIRHAKVVVGKSVE